LTGSRFEFCLLVASFLCSTLGLRHPIRL
jgi:hypothetical protein